jgi:alkanesulfonate monooxygenase SsuD/methylene tetrahydromethanopterin reductase-like flavin-dependent oxidoreductase (luciferase family)
VRLTVCINGRGFHPGGWQPVARADDLDHARLRELTALADRGGFDAALFGIPSFDDAVPLAQPDALPLVASLIAHTRAIGLGAAYRLERAEPFNIARSLATLDRLALGRTAWVIELAPAARANRAREAECIEVARKLWDSWEDAAFVVDKARGLVADPHKVHRVDHAGTYFSVRGPLNGPRPTQGYPVTVMIDPGDEDGRKLAARVADLLLVAGVDADAARDVRQSVRSVASAAGRGAGTPQVLMNVMPVLATTEAEARQVAAALGEAGVAGRPLAFVGMPERLAAELADLHGRGCCDGFNIIPARMPDDLRLLVDSTLPALRQSGRLLPRREDGTLRDRLGLVHPRSRYEPA